MPKVNARPKKKPDRKLTQRERFIEAARKAEADETGETFERAMAAVTPPKRSLTQE